MRLVAEDPSAGWLPSTGTIEAFRFGPQVRVDSGVEAGSVVSADYDSLLAKVIAHGPDHDRVCSVLSASLRAADIAGVRTNADSLAAILDADAFRAGQAGLTFLAETPEVLAASGPEGDDRVAQLLAAAFSMESAAREGDALWGFAASGWRNVATRGQRRSFVERSRGDDGPECQLEYRVRRGASAGTGLSAEVLLGPPPGPDENGALGPDERRTAEVRVQRVGANAWSVELDGIARRLEVVTRSDGSLSVRGAAGRTNWMAVPRFTVHDSAEASGGPVSPLPGSVISVHVQEGDEVLDGDLLVVVEAMKMEHRITARSDAVVGEVLVAAGDKVDAGTLLVTLLERD